jgi:hypothetical protein
VRSGKTEALGKATAVPLGEAPEEEEAEHVTAEQLAPAIDLLKTFNEKRRREIA